MKPPERLEQTDALVAALVQSHRSAAVPVPPTDEILAKIECGAPHPLDDLAPPTRAFRPLFPVRTWLAGALGAAVLASAAFVMTSERPSPPSSGGDGELRLVAGQKADMPAPPTLADPLPAIASEDVESLPSVTEPSPKVGAPSNKPSTRTPASREPAPVASASSLRRELELVTAARQGLRAGDGSACLASVDRYEQEFPSGQFSHEGQVMRIEALALLGDRKKAARLSLAFLDANPKSPYADRVRSVLARVETP